MGGPTPSIAGAECGTDPRCIHTAADGASDPEGAPRSGEVGGTTRDRTRRDYLDILFRDVHDLVLEDEQIGRALTRQSHHVLIVVLDPSLDDLAVHQFD